MSVYVFILDIIGALLLGALVAFLVTYTVQRKKIDAMKKSFQTAIREESKRSYKAGCDVASAELKEMRNQQETAYIAGYDDGVKNEQYFAGRKAKHAASFSDENAIVIKKDDDTAVIPFADLFLLMPKDKEEAQQ